ncbi:MAG: capsule assembly Wzi family protein, partial [Nitrospirota bacterium]
GRSENLGTWWRSFTGKGENEIGIEAGDQRAGFDIKLILPLKWQPLQLYAEAAGEDEAGGLPYKWAYLTGIYLPRILKFERVDFRAEYATTHVSGSPNVWYTHHIYKSGYTYKGRIIGHHMGTDSKDIFMETSYRFPERKGRISIFYDREEHNLSGAIREKKDEANLMVNIGLTKGMEIKTSYGYGKIKNMGNIPAEDKEINTIMGMISYTF